MNATTASATTTADEIVYRPLNEAWGDADALAQLRAIRAARTAGYERDRALADAADSRERAHRRAAQADRTKRRGGQGRKGLWGLLPA